MNTYSFLIPLIFGILLITKIGVFAILRSRLTANFYLFLSFELLIGLELLENYALLGGKILDWTWLFRLPDPFHFLVGVFPFIYVSKSMSVPGQRHKIPLWAHFLWLPICTSIYWPIWSGDTQFLLDKYYLGRTNQFVRKFTIFQIILALGYVTACIYQVRRYQNYIVNSFSNHKDLGYPWVNRLLISMVIFLLLSGTILSINFSQFRPADYSLVFSLMLIFFSSISFMALLGHSRTLEAESEPQPWPESTETDVEKIKQNEEKLVDFIERKKPYLDPNLKISDLARDSKIPQYLITHILNNEMKKTFYEYINEKRVEEFKTLSQQEKNNHKTILELAYEVGFNSKSTFNSNFKKIEGQTPLQFRKGQNGSASE